MKAVMLMSYGTPSSVQEVGTYFTHIRGGRRPSDEEIYRLQQRYVAIGGTSPLIKITESIAKKLQKSIKSDSSETKIYYAMKHSYPFISDVMMQMYEDGVKDVLGIVLAPHYSGMSIGTYLRTVNDTNERLGKAFNVEFIPSWYSHPSLISVWKKRITEALSKLPSDTMVIFTAHSLPKRILEIGDPYQTELKDMANLLAVQIGLQNWSFGYQSAGQTGESWLGPDVLELLESLVEKNHKTFLLAPIGFISDHLEVLYDIDVECINWAKSRNVVLARTELPNDSDDFIACLHTLIKERGFS
ncbi:MAG: ferrochelatase [Conexivisphaerales archaeon]